MKPLKPSADDKSPDPLQVEIRDAVAQDAAAACQAMRRSITELCIADHGNDSAILSSWLRNKTPEVFLSWIAQPNNSVLVAVANGIILAVGAVTNAGEITLNYVSRMQDFAASAGPCWRRWRRGL